MPNWEGSDRKVRLPKDWHKRRARVLRRDGYTCMRVVDGIRCGRPANQVDHIIASGSDEETNLEALCTDHHATKSGREGAAAFHAQRRRNDKKFRRTEKHPGLL